jgi:GT2 family glycosyltransferase
MTKVSIIVVNYRTPELTLECLASLEGEFGRGFDIEVLIVDNASGDGSADRIAAAFPQHRLMALDRNLGFAGANNHASRHATGDYILFLNPDTLVRAGAVAALLDFARRRPEAGAWGGRTLFADGSLNPTSTAAFVTLRSLVFRAVGLSYVFKGSPFFNPEPYPGWRRDSERAVGVLFFCFVLMRIEVWRRLGGFDPRFFMFCEDDDLCWRLEKAGLPRLFTPAAEIVHYGGASIPHRADRRIAILQTRGQWLDLHWPPAKAATGRVVLAAGIFVRMVAERATGRKGVWTEIWRRRAEWRRGGAAELTPAATASRPGPDDGAAIVRGA